MQSYPLALLRRSWRMFMAVAKVMVPVMLAVQIAQQYGLVHHIGALIAPAMSLLGLPAEAGIIWVTTVFTGIYGGLATFAGLAGGLDMTAAQVSALCAMMLFAHSIPVEQAIVRRAGASFWATALLRLASAVLYAALVTWICRLTGHLSESVSFAWLTGSSFTHGGQGQGAMQWLQSTAWSMGLTFLIIMVLAAALDLLQYLGITRRITALLMPVLRVSGLDAKVAPVTTVGVLLGLTYGGALIIEESEKQNFPARTRFLALSWLSLSHSLIEDTLLLLALGANIWVILVGRLAVTLLIVALLAWLTNRGNWRTAGLAAQN